MLKVTVTVAIAAFALSGCVRTVKSAADVSFDAARAGVGAGVSVGGAAVDAVTPDSDWEKCEKIRKRKKREECYEEVGAGGE